MFPYTLSLLPTMNSITSLRFFTPNFIPSDFCLSLPLSLSVSLLFLWIFYSSIIAFFLLNLFFFEIIPPFLLTSIFWNSLSRDFLSPQICLSQFSLPSFSSSCVQVQMPLSSLQLLYFNLLKFNLNEIQIFVSLSNILFLRFSWLYASPLSYPPLSPSSSVSPSLSLPVILTGVNAAGVLEGKT